MGIEITAVGGYNEVGRNMTAIKVDDTVIICDMGIHLENYIRYTEDEDILKLTTTELLNASALPDFRAIDDWKKKVKAIIPTHAHLDHVGAIPFLSNKYHADIICTPFTGAVIGKIVEDLKKDLKNKIRIMEAGERHKINEDVEIEFVNITHSTPQTIMAIIHTKYGAVIYANDFKFDMNPTFGEKPDVKRLSEIGKDGVVCLIVDSTYSSRAQKMPSESVAKEMLKDVMLGTNSKGKAVIVTTFSSHISRLKSIVEFGKKLNRKILFMGRSLSKYVSAAEDVGLVNFSDEVEIVKYSKQVKKRLKKVMAEGKEKYLLVVTGHQGEPRSILCKMVNEKMGFRFDNEDHVIFSCTVIPTPTNQTNRKYLEQDLNNLGIRLFTDIHVSGHAAREDLRDLINLLKPLNIIPAHGEPRMTTSLGDLASEMGYDKEKNVFVVTDGTRLKLNI